MEIKISVNPSITVSGLVLAPDDARACFVLAHGAGAGMRHSFMGMVATGFSKRRIATLRYQFPYMEKGSRRPDGPALAHATVRAAVAEARVRCPDLKLVAGGKSFGGRMTSQAQALEPLDGVRGLVFLGFPLHPAGKPSAERAKHLSDVKTPMLFVQGTRDGLADFSLLQNVIAELGAKASLSKVDQADHSFHVPAKSGRNDIDVFNEVLDAVAEWCSELES
jgi:predicted alpha/beta-hydrolase family hydrolase